MKLYFLDGQPILWAGSEASFEAALQAANRYLASEHANKLELRAQTYDGADGLPAMIAVQGEVGIIQVEGSLIDGEATWLRYFGMVGYDDIVAAANKLYKNPDVKRVMWRIESPGGMVSGIMDAGEAIGRLSATKPSMVYTGNLAASGGYWLATSVKGPLIAGPTAQVGSIGVVSVHTEFSKRDESQGITKTVLRSGENKARLNGIEPLAPEVKKAEEAKMADVHAIFRAQVARGRPNLTNDELLEVTDGSTFLGKRAKAAGLVDDVKTFEQALKLLDSHNPSGNTAPNSKGAPMKLSEKQISQLLSGVPAAQLGLTAEELTALQPQIDAIINAGKAGDDGIGSADKKPEVNDGKGPTPPPAASEAAVADLAAANAKVDLLTKQLSEANEKLVAKTAEVQNLNAAQEPMKAQLASLHKIAQSAISRFQIGLGAADTSESLSVADAITTHASLSEKFNTAFKIGQQTKTPTEEKTTTAAPYGFGIGRAKS